MLPALLRRTDDSTATLAPRESSNTHTPHSASTFKLNSTSTSTSQASLNTPYPFWQHEISDPSIPDSISKKLQSKDRIRSDRDRDRDNMFESSGSNCNKQTSNATATAGATHSSIYRMFHASENELSSSSSSSQKNKTKRKTSTGIFETDSLQLPKSRQGNNVNDNNSNNKSNSSSNNGAPPRRASPVTAVTTITAAAASPVTANDLSKLDTTTVSVASSGDITGLHLQSGGSSDNNNNNNNRIRTDNDQLSLSSSSSRSNSKKRKNSQSLSKPILESGHRRIPGVSDYLTDKSTSAVKDFDSSFFHFQDEYIPDINFKDIVSRWQSDNDTESPDNRREGNSGNSNSNSNSNSASSSSIGRISRASTGFGIDGNKPLTFSDLMGNSAAITAAAAEIPAASKKQKKWTIGGSPDDDFDDDEDDDNDNDNDYYEGEKQTTCKGIFNRSHDSSRNSRRVLPPISSVLGGDTDNDKSSVKPYPNNGMSRPVAALPLKKLSKQYSASSSNNESSDNDNDNSHDIGSRSKSPCTRTTTNTDAFANPFSLLRTRMSSGSLAAGSKAAKRRKNLAPMTLAKPIDIQPAVSPSSFQPSSSSLLTSPTTELPSSPPITAEELKGYMDQLPENFLSLPYSQRKRKILDILPLEKQQHYKSIMSLIKKSALRNSRTSMSLFWSSFKSDGTSYPNLANSFSGQMPVFEGKSSTSINDSSGNNFNNNTPTAAGSTMKDFQQAAHKTRHGSLASQYLSLFTPNVPTAREVGTAQGSSINIHNGDTPTPSPATTRSSQSNSFLSPVHFSRPDDKGMQLLNHTLGKIIGFGAWGIIRECTDNATGEVHAIKIVRFKTNEKIKKQVLREVDMWKRLSHPYILALKDYQIDENYAVYCLTDKINDGTLYDLVLSWDDLANTKIPLYKRCRITATLVYQMIDALKYMHSLNIIHGDVKLENCLIQKPDPGKRNWRAYLCDFGMSCFVPKKQKRNREEQVVIENGNKRTKTVVRVPRNKVSHIGSLPYASPELLSRGAISFSSDVWAFGVMLYTMLLGKLPFKHASEAKLREMIKFGNYDTKSLDFVDEIDDFKGLRDIVIGCLQVEVPKRLTIQQVEDVLTPMLEHR